MSRAGRGAGRGSRANRGKKAGEYRAGRGARNLFNFRGFSIKWS